MIHEFRKTLIKNDYPIAETRMGKLHGYVDDGVFSFRGIKYADSRRFEAPTVPEPWEGIKEALDYGYVSPMPGKEEPANSFFGPHRFWPVSEDCQYLNVWSSSLDPGSRLPVMVWFHGGGFASGSSIEMYTFNGKNLALTEDVVVVTVNHRLNILGYLNLSAYGEKYSCSGYAGILDLVLALRWVHDNISSFGGDPENVTIFGQSGGGAKVASLMQMPEAAGLFHKAIIQSGTPNFMRSYTYNETLENTDKIVRVLGLDRDSIDQIQTIPYRVMMDTIKNELPDFSPFWQPVPDNKRLYDYSVFLSEFKDIPMIVGTNLAEFFMVELPGTRDEWTEERIKEKLQVRFGEDTQAVIKAFKETYPGKDILDIFSLDWRIRQKGLEFCFNRAKNADAPIYNYLFSYTFPYRLERPAWHCAEIPFVFKNTILDDATSVGGIDIPVMENFMSAAWVQFARTGCPDNRFLPKWTPVTERNYATMFFDTYPYMREHADDLLISLLKKHPPAEDFNLMGGLN